MKACGCSTIEEMRKLSYKELTGVVEKARGGFPPKYAFSSVLDNYFLDHTPSEGYFSGQFKDIPLMVGNTAGESGMGGFQSPDVPTWEEGIRRSFGKYADQYLALAHVTSPADIPPVTEESHLGMMGNRVLCELSVKYGHQPCYLYLFDRDLPGNDDGSFHSSELWYVFGTIQRCWRPMTGVDYNLSKVMVKSWANFAKSGNPNGEGVPQWNPYTKEEPVNMRFGETSQCEPIEESPLRKFVKDVILEM